MTTNCWFSIFVGFLGLICVHSNYLETRNICGFNKGPVCCPGWRNAINKPCSIPVCGGNCGDRGFCIKPDMCMCADRAMRYACDVEEQDQMQNDQAVGRCPDNCYRNGVCENGKCICDPGYGGNSCEVALESACYTKLNRGLCDRPLQHQTSVGNITTKVTFETCCNSIGLAWGEPCQACRTSYCGRGYRAVNGACQDINECSIPGVCRRGHCINLEGTFTCKCPTGFTYDKDMLECNIINNACEQHTHQCSPGGKCVPLPNGDYKCVCNWRYEPTQNLKSCVPKRLITFDICTLYRGSICKNGACIPRGSSYECACDEGFEPSVDRKSCIHKIDMCAVHRGYLCKNGECVPMGREYYCRCNPGYTPSYDRLSCVSAITAGHPPMQELYFNPNEDDGKLPVQQTQDIIQARIQHDRADSSSFSERRMKTTVGDQQPCLRPEVQRSCAGGFCLNLGGGAYRCDCLDGFVNADDGRACKRAKTSRYKTQWQNDANEIRINRQDQKQHTTDGQKSIFSMDRKSHTRHIYLTAPHTPCSQPEIVGRCAGGICLNLGGKSYRCECLPGYKTTENGQQCIGL